MTAARRLIASGSTFEAQIGYSRAVVDGDWVFVSGTTGFDYATMSIADDVVAQAEQTFANLIAALAQAGSTLADVVRVRYMLPNAAEFARCWPVLQKHFGTVRPAATMIACGLADPRMKIEIEITARRRAAAASVAAASGGADRRLAALGLALPTAGPAAGNYATAVRAGSLLYVSARAPRPLGDKALKGRLGREYSADEGYALARSAALELLAVVHQHLGTLDAVARVVELQGTLNATTDFEDHARVLDGASDLLAEVFGAAGVHARSVVGAGSLRNGVPLTIRAVVDVVAGSTASASASASALASANAPPA